ncbi:MAG: hypothetical protein A3H98_01410 [Bacteroidetes bacterium RIFCSPLOWO2_02_FULL_36_8]|nr:MAG: hypothetical protein A3H98_01410 [Bacteroidetes bacterium RIFCSPLOWO2_02_FULL_36_8]OFY70907.1 MAG: hypothetical protein A3G23_12365 [Bacteroidetes bacterium RIFCSPLOWO2_12_FULL_37_12]
MILPRYPLTTGLELQTFEFISEGTKGRIPKLVLFTQTNLRDFYILSFGDKDKFTGDIDDKVISNNGDSEKVLATVIATIYAFTDKYQDAYIYATGSTKARTRLYRMGISKYLSEGKRDFEIYGELKDGWDDFKKGIDYNGFLVKRKKS